MESGLVLFNGDDSKNCGFGQRKQRYYGDHQSPENHRHSKIATSSKRSKRAAMKRVVLVPIKVVERARGDHKSGDGAPPADCWAWRKYGQKPIKGSPYPRGYYRCSSSKGCPARKQVERSYMDPTMLVITYSSDHNHSSPPAASRNQPSNKNIKQLSAAPDKAAISNSSNVELEELKQVEDEFGWLTGLQSAAPSSSFMMMESTVFGADFLLPAVASEEESLFADLGELPECSAVFRRRATEDVSMVYADESWYETTSSSLLVTEDCFNTTS